MNAGLNLLRNKPLFENAGTAAVTGGVFGGFNNYMDTGSILGSSPVGSQVANAASAAVPASQVGKEVVVNSVDDMGLVFNPSTGTYLNPENYVLSNTSTPIFTGGQGLLSNAFDELKNYTPDMSVGNVIGGLGVANQYANSRRPTVQAPAGGISRANPPSGEALTQLLNSVAAQPRKRISLLVG